MSWEQQSDMNLNSSSEARAKSQEIRSKVQGLIQSSCSDAMAAWSQTNK